MFPLTASAGVSIINHRFHRINTDFDLPQRTEREMKDRNIINGNCWFAYFDILGFKNKIGEYKGHLDVFKNLYEKILKKVKECNKLQPDKVSIHWFSDSFIFYCSDASISSYACIDLEIRRFFTLALWERWPLRGALTVGELYVDETQNIFLGQAIIDAHEYAEKKQDWIGLVITPMARSMLKDIAPKFARTNDVYTEYNVPSKYEIEKLLTFKFSHFPSPDKKLEMLLERMSEEQQKPEIKRKYEKTLKFIQDTKPK